MLTISRAETEAELEQIRELMAEYVAWDARCTAELGLDARAFLDFYYGPGSETLPGVFAPPDGCLLFAMVSAQPAGCGAFHRLSAATCEMKRMFVRPDFRGMGLGRRLAESLLAEARVVGYEQMRLETTTFMEGALALYTSLGFERCEPYYAIPESLRGIAIFMEKALGR